MKLTEIVKIALSNPKWLDDSGDSQKIELKLKDFYDAPCFVCGEINIDFCWNCERPICNEHKKSIIPNYLLRVGVRFCLECASDSGLDIETVKE